MKKQATSRARLLAIIWAAGAASPAAWSSTHTWIGGNNSWGFVGPTDADAVWTGNGGGLNVPPNIPTAEVFLGNNASVNLGGGAWNIAYLHLGQSGPDFPGTGLLNIDSGSITAAADTYIGDGNAGTMIINGGQYITSATKNFLLGGGTIGTSSGYLEIDSGTLTLGNKTGIVPAASAGATTINMSGGSIDFVSGTGGAGDNADTLLAGKFIFSGGTITKVANITVNELSGSGTITVLTNTTNPGMTVDQSIDTVFNGAILGATNGGKFTKLGTGVLEIGPNGSIGLNKSFNINGGTVRLGSNQSLITGTNAPTMSIGTNGVLDLNGFAYTFKIFTGTGEVKLGNGGTLTLNTTGAVSYDGPITGNGGFTKISSASTLTLTANNTYTGSTTISNGTLALVSSGTNNLSKSSSIALGSSTTGLDVTGVAGGFTLAGPVSQTLSVRGTVTGNVAAPTGTTVTGNGTLSNNLSVPGGSVAPGNAGVGTIHLSTLSLNNAKLNIDVGATNADRIIVATTDGLTLSGNSAVTLNATGALSPGTFTLIDYNGTALSDLGHLTLASPTLGGFNVSLLYNSLHATSIDLNVASIATSGSTWNFNGDGNYSDASKWDGGVPNAVDAVANLNTHGGSISAATITITLDQNATLGTLNFDHTTSSYTIAGSGTNAITMDVSTGQAAINVISGSHTIAAPVTLNKDTTITVTPAGSTLAITGNISSPASSITTAGAGTVQVENIRAVGLNVTGGTVKVREKVGTPNSNPGTSVVSGLSINSGASLDLANNALVVNYTTLGTLLSDTRQELLDGRLKTSLTSAGHTLGYADNAQLGRAVFGGVNVSSTSMLVGYTFAGDSNLDGRVNALDFNALASNFGNTAGKVWVQGDFNYDGLVNTLDFTALSQSFNQSMPAPAAGLGSLVPEPVALIPLVLATFASRKRRGGISKRD